jgi:cytochrome c oxidase subunit 2
VPEDEQKRAINVEVIGEQFKWNVRYAGSDNQLGVRNYKLTSPTNFLGIDFKDRKSWDDKLAGEIVLPVNRSVRFQIASKDIIHSFFVPTMRAQINAVPGMTTYFQLTPRYTTEQMRAKENDAAFDYVLLCNKICGAGHYNMKVKITVVSEKEYAEWLVKQQLFLNDDIKSEFRLTETNPGQGKNAIALNN